MRGLLSLAFVTLFVGSWAAAGEENILLQLGDVRLVRLRQKEGVKPAAATAKIGDDGELVLGVQGAARARARWLVPLNLRLPVDGEFSFSLDARNIVAPAGRPNVFLLLQQRGEKADTPRKVIPAFTAIGRENKEVGRVKFSLAKGDYYLHSLQFDISVAEKGAAVLELSALQISFAGNRPAAAELAKVLKRQPSSRAAVQTAAGQFPALAVNGKTIDPMMGIVVADTDNCPDLKEVIPDAGLNVNFLTIPLGGAGSLWSYPGFFDTQRLDRMLRAVCVGGGSYVVLALQLAEAPPWWLRQQQAKGGAAAVVSDFNPEWRAYCVTALRQLLGAVRESPLDRWVVGAYAEVGPDRNRRPPATRAGHPGYLQAFRDNLKEMYQSDQELQAAWQDPEVSLATATPLPATRWAADRLGLLRRAGGSRRDLDSFAFENRSWLAWQLALCRQVKASSSGQYITGVANGAARLLNDLDQPVSMTYGACSDLLAAEGVDFVVLDAAGEPRLGAGTSGRELLLAPVLRRHGKLLFRRHRAFFGPADKPEQQRLEYGRRNLATALSRGSVALLACKDMNVLKRGWVQGELTRYKQIRRRLAGRRRPARAEIAFVIDPAVHADLVPTLSCRDSRAPASLAHNPLFHLLTLPRVHWPRLGAPYDVITTGELRGAKYKLVVFFHTISLTAAQRQQALALRRGGRVLAWVWADGLRLGNELAAKHQTQLTDIAVRLQETPQRLFLTPAAAMGEFLKIREVEDHLGAICYHRNTDVSAALTFAPVPIITDERGKALADLAEGGRRAMALRQWRDGMSFYSSSPVLNSEVLRALARQAGVHLYVDGNDQAFYSAATLGFMSAAPGQRVINLRSKGSLYEVFHDRNLKASAEHVVEIEGDRTYLFFFGDKSAWQKPPAAEAEKRKPAPK